MSGHDVNPFFFNLFIFTLYPSPAPSKWMSYVCYPYYIIEMGGEISTFLQE